MAPSHITTLYRQNLSNLLFYNDAILQKHPHNGPDNNLTSWIGDTARSLALRAATPFADETTAVNTASQNNDNQKKNTPKKSNSKNAKNVSPGDIVRTIPPHWSDFVCMTCGTFLFPPIIPTTNTITDDGKDNNSTISVKSSQTPSLLPTSNIYLRPLKRGRTRRRRASRSKAKQLHNHTLSLQRRGGASNTNNIRKDALAKEEMQRIASSYRLGDGRAKNCLVMCCTFCGAKKKRKGLEVEKDPKSGGGGKVGVDGGVEKQDAGRKKRHEKRPEKGVERKNVASQIRDNSDFISLSSNIGGGGGGGGGKKKYAKEQQQQHRDSRQVVHDSRKRNQDDSSDALFISPLLRGKKKKKTKTPDAKKGKLMDFLSSLND